MPFFCYLLRCADGSYYCGWTTDLQRRLAMHRRGRGARYTRMNGPVELAYYEEAAGRSAAMKREREIKRMTHERKDAMAREFPDEKLSFIN